MSGIAMQSLMATIDISYRARSLAAVVADLAGLIDEAICNDSTIEKKRLGQIIHLAEVIEGYSAEAAARLEQLVPKLRGERP